jgi:hypothetical protein
VQDGVPTRLNPAAARADEWGEPAMRQLTPLTNLALTVLLAAGLVVTLGLPWYGHPPERAPEAPEPGQIEALAATIARMFGDAGAKVVGAEAAPAVKVALVAIAGASALLAVLMLLAPLRSVVRPLLKAVPMAAAAAVLVALLDVPGGMELRWGIFAALAAALAMANSAFHGAELRAPRPAPARYVPPPPPPGSFAPPGV